MTAKKCTETRDALACVASVSSRGSSRKRLETLATQASDARAELLFYLFNLLLFWRSRCRRRRDV